MENKRYVGVLIKYGKQILLVKRKVDNEEDSIWTIPGGKMIEGLKIREAAQQMLLDTTSIDVEIEKLHLVGLIPRESKDGTKDKGLMYVFLYEAVIGVLPIFKSCKTPHKHSKHGYFTSEYIQYLNCGKHLPKFVKTIFS